MLDFGLMRVDCDSVGRVRRDVVIAAPAYIAPEQAASAPGDNRSDLFSLGVVLFHLTTGQMPFPGTTLREVMGSFASATAPLASQYNPHLPPALVKLIQKMLNRDPEARPGSATEVAELLLEIENQRSTPQKSGTKIDARWYAGVGAAMLIIVAGAIWMNWPKPAPTRANRHRFRAQRGPEAGR